MRAAHLGILLLVLWISAPGWGAPATAAKLRVAVGGSAPFVIEGPMGPDGISVRLWVLISEQLSLASEYIPCKSAQEAVDLLEQGKADLVVGPVSLTQERLARLDLTVPYFLSHVGILTRAHYLPVWDRIRPFLETSFTLGTLGMVLALLLVGVLVWLAEKDTNGRQFPADWRRGPWDGLWFAMATMTGVGYGDRCPQTRRGRLVACVWMLVGSIFFSTLTAGIVTAMTLSHLPGEELTSTRSLTGRRVAVLKTLRDDLLDHSGAHLYKVESLTEAMQLFDQGRVDCVVHPYPGLEYLVRKNHREAELSVSKATDELTLLAFALPRHSPLTEKINMQIVRLYEEEQLRRCYEEWTDALSESL